MTIPQLADLFSVLPFDAVQKLLDLLNTQVAEKVRIVLADPEPEADDIMSQDYVVMPKEAKVGDVLDSIRRLDREPRSVSYVYVVSEDTRTLIGVVDLRKLVLADDNTALEDIMISPAVTADKDDSREDLAEIFSRYHYRMIPIVNNEDHILGVIYYNEIMKGLVPRT